MNKTVGPSEGLLALMHAAFAAQAKIEASLGAIGLSWAKLSALQALERHGGSLPLGQLAGELACVKSNVTQLVDRLDADGLVSREPDPKDRRGRLAVLTAAGRKACAAGTVVKRKTEQALLGSLTTDEIRSLAGLAGRVEEHAK